LSAHPTPAPATPDPPPSPKRWYGLIGMGLGIFMFTLDGSIVNVALPTLVSYFGTTFATVQWVVLVYLLIITTLGLGAGRVGDLYGRKRVYLVGLGIFTVASLLCGLSPGVHWLIACRALQGLGAVFVSALGAAIIAQTFPANERGRALGVIGSSVTLGVALGPSVGGLIIALAGWRWMFLVNIPVGIAAMTVVARLIPDLHTTPVKVRFDWAGLLLFAASLGCLSFALNWGQRLGFETAPVLGLFALAVGSFVLLLYVERRVPGPILDLHMFADRSFSLGLLSSTLVFVVVGGAGFIMPFFLELVLGYPIAKVGLLMAISPVLGGFMAPVGGAFADRFGPRGVSLVGVCVLTLGCFLLATLDETTNTLRFALCVAPMGLGMGLFSAANNTSVLNAVPRERLGAGSAMLSLARTLGQSTGVPLVASLFGVIALGHAGGASHEALLGLPSASLVHGVRASFAAAGGIALLAVAAGLWRLRAKQTASSARSGRP
jgi:EmrB/QacA subfamily drug resistance transporter